MPPESVPIFASGAAGEPGELEQLRDARVDGVVGEAEVAAVHQQVLGHGEVRVEVVHLRHDADAQARLARARRHRPGRPGGCRRRRAR
jgi:hypothetical protein